MTTTVILIFYGISVGFAGVIIADARSGLGGKPSTITNQQHIAFAFAWFFFVAKAVILEIGK